MKIVIACSKLWVPSIAGQVQLKTGGEVHLITDKDQLTAEHLQKLKPDYVFFPHWSHILKPEIFNSFKCIMFHMTDLPYGRGGSPLQNLILRGHKETKISAFLCDGGIDSGPVYLKKDLELDGTAQEIFVRATMIIIEMIAEIVKTKPVPVAQAGQVTEFKRRQPVESELKNLSDVEKIFDFIRMLDAEGYPSAYLNFGNFKIEFKGAKLQDGKLEAQVTISPQQEKL